MRGHRVLIHFWRYSAALSMLKILVINVLLSDLFYSIFKIKVVVSCSVICGLQQLNAIVVNQQLTLCRAADNELMEASGRLMKNLDDQRVAARTADDPPMTTSDFVRWLNTKWENISVPLVIVPYNGTLHIARLSHSAGDYWHAVGT